MTMFYIWIAIMCVGLVVEFLDAGTLVSVWVSVGAIIPLIMSLFKITAVWYITLQVVIFGVVTALCIIFLRKLCKKLIFKNTNEKTNLEIHVGKKTKVLEIENGKALVKINDIIYSAISEVEDEKFEANETVEIVKFSGNKVIIKKCN